MNLPGFRRGAVICKAEVVGSNLEDREEGEEEEEKGKDEEEVEVEAMGGVVEG